MHGMSGVAPATAAVPRWLVAWMSASTPYSHGFLLKRLDAIFWGTGTPANQTNRDRRIRLNLGRTSLTIGKLVVRGAYACDRRIPMAAVATAVVTKRHTLKRSVMRRTFSRMPVSACPKGE